ncbi:MAG: hypothetical protein K0B11_02820 [Mariniphaga sp.]|nr:hypothetical protein [Mariniphaga sp.]
MNTEKQNTKLEEELPDFNYNKNWYLVPYYPFTNYFPEREDLGPLYEGRILKNTEQFNDTKYVKLLSFIFITDLNGLLQNLSEPYVYPVKIEKGTKIKLYSNRRWMAEKVELLKPLNFWEIFSKAESIFDGSISFEGQPYLPNNIKLPTTIKEELIFIDNFLPSDIQLPEIVDGTMLIRSATIPPTWQFPRKIGRLFFENCTFFENVDFTKINVNHIKFFNCYHPPLVPFPEIFPGDLFIDADVITADFVFPKQIGSLCLYEVKLEKNVVLPEKVERHITFANVVIDDEVKISSGCKEFSALECNFTNGLIFPDERLEKIDLTLCTLPKSIVIPNIPKLNLSFTSMKIRAGLKIGKVFSGSLIFNDCEFAKGFQMPYEMNGTLKIVHNKTKAALKLPEKGDYHILIESEADLEGFDISESVKSKIRLIPQDNNSEASPNDNLPF